MQNSKITRSASVEEIATMLCNRSIACASKMAILSSQCNPIHGWSAANCDFGQLTKPCSSLVAFSVPQTSPQLDESWHSALHCLSGYLMKGANRSGSLASECPSHPDKRKHQFQAPLMWRLRQSSLMYRDYVITSNGARKKRKLLGSARFFLSLKQCSSQPEWKFQSVNHGWCVMWWRTRQCVVGGGSACEFMAWEGNKKSSRLHCSTSESASGH